MANSATLTKLRPLWVYAFVALFFIAAIWVINLHPGSSAGSITFGQGKSKLVSPGEQGLIFESKPTSSSEALASHATLQVPECATPSPPASQATGQSHKPTDRPLILYAHFETAGARINLEFFLRHAIHSAADFLFVLNGDFNDTHIIPNLPNVQYLHRPNDCYDLGGMAEVLQKDDLYKKYSRFITINSSIRGPFIPIWSDGCWSDMFLKPLSDKIKLVGMTMACKPIHHIQSMIWATDRIGIETLLFPTDEQISKLYERLGEYEASKWQPVPDMKVPGINSCPHEYWDAVSVEVHATPLLQAAGYEVEAIMSAFRGDVDYQKVCGDVGNGDVLWPKHYYGMDIHPYDTVFVKSNRGNDPIVLQKMTEWADGRNYSSFDYCH